MQRAFSQTRMQKRYPCVRRLNVDDLYRLPSQARKKERGAHVCRCLFESRSNQLHKSAVGAISIRHIFKPEANRELPARDRFQKADTNQILNKPVGRWFGQV